MLAVTDSSDGRQEIGSEGMIQSSESQGAKTGMKRSEIPESISDDNGVQYR